MRLLSARLTVGTWRFCRAASRASIESDSLVRHALQPLVQATAAAVDHAGVAWPVAAPIRRTAEGLLAGRVAGGEAPRVAERPAPCTAEFVAICLYASAAIALRVMNAACSGERGSARASSVGREVDLADRGG